MSYVLEALQKREAENDPDAAVSLARAGFQKRRHRLWAGLFALAMVVNAGVLAWLVLTPDGPAASSAGDAPAPLAAPIGGNAPAPAAAVQAPIAAAEGAIEAATPPAAVQTEAVPSPAPVFAAPPPPPVRLPLRELPADVRARFPGLAFSTHVYSEHADLRAVVANGQRLTEGDLIQGLRIDAITESGVVLAFERYLVEVPVFTDWDAL